MVRRRRMKSMRGRLAVLGAVLTAAAFLPGSGLGVVEIEELQQGLDNFDVRAVESPSAAQRAEARKLRANVSWNRYGTAQSLFRYRGYLSKPLRVATPAAAARSWLRSHRTLFKLRTLKTVRVERVVRLGTGRVVVLREVIGGRPTYDGVATISLARDGGGWRVVHVSSSLSGEQRLRGMPRLNRAEALTRAARNIGARLSVIELNATDARGGWHFYKAARLKGVQSARLVALATRGGAIPAYQTVVAHQARNGTPIGYMHLVDARNGRVLVRENTVDHSVDNPRWKVFPANPHTALDEFPWNYPSADIRDLWCWLPDPHCQYLPSTNIGNRGVPWDQDARTGAPTFTTVGNNARSAEAWFSPFNPGPTGYMPVSPTRDYVYPWENQWFEQRCNPAVFAVPGVGNDISAATVNLFAMHNRMHDWSYNLGFREATWNGQEHNFGINPAGERDPLEGIVQAGGANGGYPTYSGRDNAFMRTNPDGTRSQSGMFLWQPLAGSFYAPCVDGDYDMSVIGHEYGHMIENRMIGKGNRRLGSHAGMMGESHGDQLAMEYVSEYRFHGEGGGGDNPVADAALSVVGSYATGNSVHGIRNYDMGFAYGTEYPLPGRYPTANPLNFGAIGYDITGPQVHADGEIWSVTNFDLRELLLNRYPSNGTHIQRECADGLRPVYDCPGNRRWVQLLFDAFLLMPVRPTFLDARNAILAADVLRFGGANQDLLWLGFARRGFGQNALNSSSEDFDPIPDFESPLHDEATVVFNTFALNEGNAPIVNANFYVGHYEARVSPIADTNPATAGQNRDNVARFAPDDGARTNNRFRAYDFIVTAQGYGAVRFRLTELKPGETRVVNIYMPTNWASRHKGAVAAGDGVRHNDLIDDTEATNWEFSGTPIEGRQVLIDLAGGEHRVNQVKVGTLLLPGQNRFTALREFEVYACGESPRGDVVVGGVTYACQRVVNSQWDAFPSTPPRPVAPDMILRTWESGNGNATHVLFRVIDNQCTGQPAFQGEQDNDPANTSTDCRIGTLPPLPPRNTQVRTSEVQIFSHRPRADGAQVIE